MGETRRFIDEIEYLLGGLNDTGPKSDKTIRSSIEDIVEKCFTRSDKKNNNGDYSVNVGFGMKLKSHGALGTIFEALHSSNDPVVLDNLVLLITALLYDVRRLDFFFKPELAIKLSKHCINSVSSDDEILEMLKCTQLFSNVKGSFKASKDVFMYVAIWILSKWSFSSVTTRNDCGSFFNLLTNEPDLLKKVVDVCKESEEMEVGEKAAGLLDCLLNRKLLLRNEQSLMDLLESIIKTKNENITFMKLAVSLTGAAPLTTKLLHLIESFIKISLPLVKGEIEILSLTCVVNLIDRCDDSVLDEFRYRAFADEDCNLLQYLTKEYFNCPKDDEKFELHKSMLALILGFICRQNRTNIEVMSRAIDDEKLFNELKCDIYSVASKFYIQQQGQSTDEIVMERLNEIILTFKK